MKNNHGEIKKLREEIRLLREEIAALRMTPYTVRPIQVAPFVYPTAPSLWDPRAWEITYTSSATSLKG